MMHRVLSLAAAVAVVVFVGTALADKVEKSDKDKAGSTVVGTISVAGDGKITVTDKDGKDHALAVAKDARIQCDGKDCKLEDLKKGAQVTVTLNANDKTTADQIDAKSGK